MPPPFSLFNWTKKNYIYKNANNETYNKIVQLFSYCFNSSIFIQFHCCYCCWNSQALIRSYIKSPRENCSKFQFVLSCCIHIWTNFLLFSFSLIFHSLIVIILFKTIPFWLFSLYWFRCFLFNYFIIGWFVQRLPLT